MRGPVFVFILATALFLSGCTWGDQWRQLSPEARWQLSQEAIKIGNDYFDGYNRRQEMRARTHGGLVWGGGGDMAQDLRQMRQEMQQRRQRGW